MGQELPDECCWCGKDISNSKIWTVPIKFKENSDHPDVRMNGYILEKLKVGNRNVWAIVTGLTSKAKQKGMDMIFQTCSKKCAREIKGALKEDKEKYDF